MINAPNKIGDTAKPKVTEHMFVRLMEQHSRLKEINVSLQEIRGRLLGAWPSTVGSEPEPENRGYFEAEFTNLLNFVSDTISDIEESVEALNRL